MKKTNATTILGNTGHSSFLTVTVRCGARVYVVEVTRDICPRANPDRALDVAIWGASRLSVARRNAIGLAVTTHYATRYAYSDGFDAPRFREIEAAGTLAEYRWSNRMAGIAA